MVVLLVYAILDKEVLLTLLMLKVGFTNFEYNSSRDPLMFARF
jgi:hypothetical protein